MFRRHHRFTLIGLLVVSAFSGLFAALALTQTPAPAPQAATRETFPTSDSSPTREARAPVSSASPVRKPISFYAVETRANLFAAPQPPQHSPLPLAPLNFLARTTRRDRGTTPIAVPAPPDRFADYVYSGSVTVNGQTQALLENSRTKEGWYVKVGEAIQGEIVTSISSDSLTLTVDGKPRLFVKSSPFLDAPLKNGSAGRPVTANGASPQASAAAIAAQQRAQPTPPEAVNAPSTVFTMGNAVRF